MTNEKFIDALCNQLLAGAEIPIKGTVQMITIEELQGLHQENFLKVAETYASQAGKDFNWLNHKIILSEAIRRMTPITVKDEVQVKGRGTVIITDADVKTGMVVLIKGDYRKITAIECQGCSKQVGILTRPA